jgi:hypothetical protein
MNERLMRLMGHRKELHPVQLERGFPHILEKLMGLWGTSEFDALAGELLLNNRTDRTGFPPDVAVELFHLANLHKEQMKLLPHDKTDIWGHLSEDEHRGTMDWDEG